MGYTLHNFTNYKRSIFLSRMLEWSSQQCRYGGCWSLNYTQFSSESRQRIEDVTSDLAENHRVQRFMFKKESGFWF